MLAIFFLFGLIIGSFLNVVTYRLHEAETLLGRSYCPHCKKQIRWYDNIPLLSFILLQGRCRDCKKKISWQYPLMEFGVGIVFALIGSYFFTITNYHSWIETIFYLSIFSLLAVIFAYDLKYMEIPMIIFWIAIVISFIFILIWDWLNFDRSMGIFSLQIFSGILAGGVAFLFFFILVSVSKEKWMGMGDAYLAFLVGLLAGWPLVLFSLILAFGIGALIGIGLVLKKKKTMQSQIPFAPFMIIGLFLAIFLPKIFPQIKISLLSIFF